MLSYMAGLFLAACGQQDATGHGSTNGAEGHRTATVDLAEPKQGTSIASQSVPAQEPGPAQATNPCRVQDGKELSAASLKAVGTEPFWAAQIEGRCVTYMTPENQKGTRIWTRYTPGPGGGTWSGALGGKRFELRTRSAAGCSDGMSDKTYPIEAELTVLGEDRRGCAEPI
jgi:uncharacterized membrane protein